jgi:CCR4-NOT transcription complex subunit 2
LAEEEAHQKPAPFREGSVASQTSLPGAIGMASDLRNPLGAIGKDAPSGRSHEDGQSRRQTDVQDPLAGMAEVDKWGLKGLRTLMNNYPDYNAMVIGIDPSTLGLDLTSPE